MSRRNRIRTIKSVSVSQGGCVDEPLYCATSLSQVWSFSKHETTSVPIIVIYRAGRTEEISPL